MRSDKRGQPMTEERWQELYLKLVNETDESRIERGITELETALRERSSEIDYQVHAEEYRLLVRTIASVNRLKLRNLRPTNLSISRSHHHDSPRFKMCATLIDLDHKYVEVSDEFCRLVGYSRIELIGMRYDELTAPYTNDIEAVFTMFKELGHMQGLWILLNRAGERILVRYESRLREDLLIEGKLEPLDMRYALITDGQVSDTGHGPATVKQFKML